MNRILPSEQLKQEIEDLLAGRLEGADDLLSELIRKGTQKLLQESLEQEAKDYLGRDYYERKTCERKGYRNGYEPKRLKTAEGLINLLMPQIRNTDEPYRRQLLDKISGQSEEFKRLVTEMYVRGLSTRDIESVFQNEEGQSYLSKSAVSEITDSLNDDYEAFIARDLSQYDVVYLFVDAVYESLRLNYAAKEGLFCAWGILSNGHKVMLHLALGNRESSENWKEFFEHMQRRGLRVPLLIISDGNPGMLNAIDASFPLSKRQRCLFHKLSNIANKLPKEGLDEVMPEIRSCYYAQDQELARQLAIKIIDRFAKKYPSAMKCFQDDFEACIAFLEFPKGHHKFIRTTNLLERCFEEQKRRTKVIPRFLGEQSAIKLVFATLIRVSERWRKIKMTSFDLALLRNIRSLYSKHQAADANEEFISMKLAA